ncbi:DNA-binding transcriptional regulator, AcrR family [Allokutzneria albata]|uniref:DNA-binding transcriptional regulator, AcrR family n=2 Tax=Allokutzneria albata TaxID=211114 RepID=A0A1G9V1S5_ALLAB|nr:DNA-binding transcriptional regulator, AcrR family [Allokutzneria albata]
MAGGRPRESRVDHALTAATRELLAETGYAKLTVDAVAARAGVGKAAIYRRFATKQELVFSAVVHGVSVEVPPDAGSLEADLLAVLRDIVTSLSGPALTAIPGLLADVSVDPGRFEEIFIAGEQACLRAVLGRAVSRGELPEVPDVDVVHALLLGPVFVWLFLLRREEPPVELWASFVASSLRLPGNSGPSVGSA